MSDTLGILFLHHEINDVVLQNLSSVKRHNPDATIVTMSAGDALPSGYTLATTPKVKILHSVKPKRSGDWLICSWLMQRREERAKWWITDWDVFCTMSVQEYYQPVWQFPFVASNVRRPDRDPKWCWFQAIKDLPAKYQSFALGVAPSIYLLDDVALRRIGETMLDEPFFAGNAELRFATIANWCGFPPCGYSPPNDNISCKPVKVLTDQRSIFHPVKIIVNADVRQKS